MVNNVVADINQVTATMKCVSLYYLDAIYSIGFKMHLQTVLTTVLGALPAAIPVVGTAVDIAAGTEEVAGVGTAADDGVLDAVVATGAAGGCSCFCQASQSMIAENPNTSRRIKRWLSIVY